MKKIFLLAALLLTISGCAASIQYEEVFEHGNGAVESEVIVVGYEDGDFGNESSELRDIYVPQSFGWKVSEGLESLVEFTVLSKERKEGVPSLWSWDYHNLFVLHIDDVLLGNNTLLRRNDALFFYYRVLQTDDVIIDDNTLYNWPSKGEEVSIISHVSVVLEEGQRYLAFIGPNGLDGRFIARINEDRSITATGHLGFYFLEHDGYTVEQLMEIAREVLVYGYIPSWDTLELYHYLRYMQGYPQEITRFHGDLWIFQDIDEASRFSTDIVRAEVLDSRVEVLDMSSGEPIPGVDMSIFHHLHVIYRLNVLEVFKGNSVKGSVLEVAHNLQLYLPELTINPGDDLIFFCEEMKCLAIYLWVFLVHIKECFVPYHLILLHRRVS